MKFRLYIAALFCLVLAASPAGSGSMLLTGVGPPPVAAGGGCAQATAFLARNGNAHPTETTTLICGLVTDGDFANLDALYIFATDTSPHALLNLISTSFTATITGTPTFTANTGFTGTATADWIDTGFVPSTAAGHYSQNSASFGYYNRTSSTAADSSTAIGIQNLAFIVINQAASTFVDVNEGNFPSVAALNHQGMFVATRTAASGAGALTAYKNSSGSAFLTDTGASASNPTVSFFALASNGAGSGVRSSTDQISAVFIGGGLTSAAAVRISNRINAYMTTLGINVY